MSLYEQKQASNKKQLEALPAVLENVALKVKDQTVDSDFEKIEKEKPQKFGGGKSVYYQNKEVPGVFPAGSIRIYVPFYGMTGHTPTEEQLRTILETGQVRVDDNVSKAGNPYSRMFKFESDVQSEFGKKGNYFGELTAELIKNKKAEDQAE